MKTLANEVEVVLFDLGGVLVELRGVATMAAWMGSSVSVDEMWRRWLTSPVVRQFESGRAEPDEFAERVIREMGLPVEKQEFLSAFRNWLRGLYPGALDVVRSVPERFTRATLSNTSVLHWPRLMTEFALEQAFDHHFASHLTGRMKPDAEAFEHVLHTLDCKPSAVFFLDDNALNVDAAKKVGMHAARVNGPVEARRALIEAGIVNGTGT
ncbi:MAG TPA: HAD family phosphatase [Candidatus Angelobacter sp.]